MNINPKNKFMWLGITFLLLLIASAFVDDPFALVESIYKDLK